MNAAVIQTGMEGLDLDGDHSRNEAWTMVDVEVTQTMKPSQIMMLRKAEGWWALRDTPQASFYNHRVVDTMYAAAKSGKWMNLKDLKNQVMDGSVTEDEFNAAIVELHKGGRLILPGHHQGMLLYGPPDSCRLLLQIGLLGFVDAPKASR